jgi:hypothetical protein
MVAAVLHGRRLGRGRDHRWRDRGRHALRLTEPARRPKAAAAGAIAGAAIVITRDTVDTRWAIVIGLVALASRRQPSATQRVG